MTPGDRDELVRLARKAIELRDRTQHSGTAHLDWPYYQRALSELREMITPGLVLELLGEGHG